MATPKNNEESSLAQLQQEITQLKAENRRLKKYLATLTQQSVPVASVDKDKPFNEVEEKANQNYQALMQCQEAIAVFRGPQYRFTFVNPAYEALTGYKQEWLLDKPLLSVFPQLEIPEYLDLIAKVIATGQPAVIKERFFQPHPSQNVGLPNI